MFMYRLLAFFLPLVLALSAGPGRTLLRYAAAQPGVIITGCEPGTEDLTIPAELEGRPVFLIRERAFAGNAALRSVTIADGLKEIQREAFRNCTSLERVTIPGSVQTFGDGLRQAPGRDLALSMRSGIFAGCTALTGVTLGEGIVMLDSGMFSGCTALEGIRLPSTLHMIGAGAFRDCTALKSAGLPEGVTSVGIEVFAGCTALEEVLLPDSLTRIGEGAFAGCRALKTLSVPEGVTEIGGNAFLNCSALTEVLLPSTLTVIGESAFAGCSGLTSLRIPDGVTRIGKNAFDGCAGLTLIAGRGTTAAERCRNTGLPYAYDDDPLTRYVLKTGTDGGFSWMTNEDGSVTVTGGKVGGRTLEIPAGLSGCPVTAIGSLAFAASGRPAKGTQPTALVIPEGVTSVGDKAFSGRVTLTAVTLPASLTAIGEDAFAGCERAVFTVVRGSYAEQWCAENGLAAVYAE